MHRLACLLALAPTIALAQPQQPPEPHVEPPQAVRYAERTEIDFQDGIHLEAELIKPRIRINIERIEGRFNPLIHLRKDFDQELFASVSEIR